jgi:hypothetical protein
MAVHTAYLICYNLRNGMGSFWGKAPHVYLLITINLRKTHIFTHL